MKTFKVFRHPTLGFQAVKVGFSWPGFFFLFIWAFVKKLWGYAFAIIGILIILTIIEKLFMKGQYGYTNLLMEILLRLIVYIFVGLKGNEWRISNLQKRGFELVDTLQAESPDAAIGKVAKT